MTRILRASVTFIGLMTTALLCSSYFSTLRGLVNRTEDNALALAIPFLIFTATLVALNSGLFATILSIVGLALFGLALAEDGFSLLKGIALVGVLITLALCVLIARNEADEN